MTDIIKLAREAEQSAVKTLEQLGYTYHGGELWKPPLGKAPDFNLIDSLRADAERLNWLQRNLFGHRWNGVMDSGSRTSWEIWSGYRHVTANMIGDTFRAAIDAARAKEQT